MKIPNRSKRRKLNRKFEKKSKNIAELGERLRKNQKIGKTISSRVAEHVELTSNNADAKKKQNVKRSLMGFYNDDEKAESAFFENEKVNRSKKNKK